MGIKKRLIYGKTGATDVWGAVAPNSPPGSTTGNNILLRFIAALKACAVVCTVNAGFPSNVTQL